MQWSQFLWAGFVGLWRGWGVEDQTHSVPMGPLDAQTIELLSFFLSFFLFRKQEEKTFLYS
jgi:hypothetical protein